MKLFQCMCMQVQNKVSLCHVQYFFLPTASSLHELHKTDDVTLRNVSNFKNLFWGSDTTGLYIIL